MDRSASALPVVVRMVVGPGQHWGSRRNNPLHCNVLSAAAPAAGALVEAEAVRTQQERSAVADAFVVVVEAVAVASPVASRWGSRRCCTAAETMSDPEVVTLDPVAPC